MKCFKSTHFSTIALQTLHRWHLSHHKNDGKCTMEVFKTKDNKGSPSWEVQYRPWAPSWDITLLVSSRSLGLKSHCRFESLWLLNQQAELRRGLYAYNLDAELCRKTSQTSPEGQVWTTGEKIGSSHALYSDRSNHSALSAPLSRILSSPHPGQWWGGDFPTNRQWQSQDLGSALLT